MKYIGWFALVVFLGFTSCSTDTDEDSTIDPCETANNLECDTQDFDMDGVPNGEDEAPEDNCVPTMPEFEVIVIGTWEWSLLGVPGEIRINADGTYDDIENTLLSNGDVVSRMWSTDTDPLALRLRVQNSNGLNASITLVATDIRCDEIELENAAAPALVFKRK